MSLDRLCRAVFCCFLFAAWRFWRTVFTAVALCRSMREAQRTRHFPLRFSRTVDVVSILLNLCRSMREAQRTRHFPLRFSRTVDVVSILLNVAPRHATKYNLQVKKHPKLTIAIYRTANGISL
jgi:hypothetical protein